MFFLGGGEGEDTFLRSWNNLEEAYLLIFITGFSFYKSVECRNFQVVTINNIFLTEIDEYHIYMGWSVY